MTFFSDCTRCKYFTTGQHRSTSMVSEEHKKVIVSSIALTGIEIMASDLVDILIAMLYNTGVIIQVRDLEQSQIKCPVSSCFRATGPTTGSCLAASQ